MSDGTEIKDRQRAMWSSGDYEEVASTIESAATGLVEKMQIGSGHTVLDVACGTGNATIPAAQSGAEVTGLDITPKLLEIGRSRAAEAGVDVTFVEGDAEALPFADASFDRVSSVFGAMFAPDQAQTAGELARVCRPGGQIGFCAWTPDGLNGRLFALMATFLPPPPEDFDPPVLWGIEERVRELFGPQRLEPAFERRDVVFEDESVESWVAFHERTLGPVVVAKAALEPIGRWDAARDALVDHYEAANESDDGRMLLRAEYLMTTIDR